MTEKCNMDLKFNIIIEKLKEIQYKRSLLYMRYSHDIITEDIEGVIEYCHKQLKDPQERGASDE